MSNSHLTIHVILETFLLEKIVLLYFLPRENGFNHTRNIECMSSLNKPLLGDGNILDTG